MVLGERGLAERRALVGSPLQATLAQHHYRSIARPRSAPGSRGSPRRSEVERRASFADVRPSKVHSDTLQGYRDIARRLSVSSGSLPTEPPLRSVHALPPLPSDTHHTHHEVEDEQPDGETG